MIKALLRQKDGLSSGRVWLGSVVKNVQLGLIQAGHPMKTDGQFGPGTLGAVKTFQLNRGLTEGEIVDKSTWNALDNDLQAATAAHTAQVARLLEGFDGDLDWVHQKEGHQGRPYWPGGESGVTLDPGVDLGHASSDLIEELYRSILSEAEMSALREVFGIQGNAANAALKASPVIQAIRVSSDQALEVMPHAAKSYWDAIRGRFDPLSREGTPPSVKTALLSLAYNRGSRNEGLQPLGEPMQSGQWGDAARIIGSMQQDHKLEGIRIRRRQEGLIIEAELEFLASS